MIKLTKRQSEVMDMIREFIAETGFPPTRAEIAKHLGFKSPNAAEEHLKALSKKGAIEILPGASRGLKIVEELSDELPVDIGLPIIGKVAAGFPILAQENVSSYVQIPPEMFYPKADYFLSVTGMSMKDIGIFDGDLIAVHKTNSVKNGQVVVARIDNEVTVKRFQQDGKIIHLIAENSEFNDITVDLETTEFAIEGISVGVIRQSL
ncbi:transcriptional repressor LexA [Marinomonas sp. 2405UD68-3]|uniref:transcriptional repressor LexA n=1 Tax=Marinomonas sp. 2405UD68-3 TaxID=3391835 RepID=UPI0039C95C09